MIELAEAQARLFALRAPVEVEHVPLNDAVGRWASEDMLAKRTQPARDLSAMDGYAIRAEDSPGPWHVIGESAAGRLFADKVGAGEAVRIFTGAVVPEGADCILIQENTARDGDKLILTGEAPAAEKHIRRAGADFTTGSVLVGKGDAITPARTALLAMGGHAIVPVHRKLRIAIVSTGDELVPPGAECADDQVPSSNSVMLAAMLSGLPVEIEDRGISKDDLRALTTEFAGCADHDIVVTIGGASVGDHDLVRPALKQAGAVLDFWKIAMRPGKPVMAGMLGDAIVLGLPGNPVSAFVTAFLLLKPLTAHLSGASTPLPARIEAKSGADLPANGNRLDHIRGVLRQGVAMPTGQNDSSMLAALSLSNILIIRNINAMPVEAGDMLSCLTIS
jgi:molybdopterin molybdotransferase